MSKHYLVTIGNRQVFVDHNGGLILMERQSGEEPKVALEHADLAYILMDQQDPEDEGHPQGQSG